MTYTDQQILLAKLDHIELLFKAKEELMVLMQATYEKEILRLQQENEGLKSALKFRKMFNEGI